MLLYLILILCAFGLYKLIAPLNHWKKRGVIQGKVYPIAGSFYKMMLRKASFLDITNDLYKEFPDLRYNGILQFTSPAILVRDLDLLKQILVKDFDHFTDHRPVGVAEHDPFFTKNLAALKGDTWRDMRATLSPAFTSSKMRAMFPLMAKCAGEMAEYFASQKIEIHDLEMKDLFTRYTNDVIATCAFGVDCNSFKEKENEFYMMGADATNLNGWRGVKIFILNFFPGIVNLCRMTVFPSYITDFFMTTVKESMDYRDKNNVIRPDMIHLLMEARKGKLKHEKHETKDDGFAVVEESSIGKEESSKKEITDMDIASQAFLFFFAGFDTTSTLLSFLSYELALNPDIQEKLYQEVKTNMDKCQNELTYDAVMEMKYLDMVVCETLRKWPPGPLGDRYCTKEYTIQPVEGEKALTLKPGDAVALPIYGLHMDEKYFPKPEKFDPERFSDENKSSIEHFSYIPFGMGPRGCIGSRFALLEAKIVVAYMLSKFEFVITSKSEVPLKVSKTKLKMEPDTGFWLGIKARA